MSKSSTSAVKNVRYRQRLRDAGLEEILLQLPSETVALLDAIKERQALRSRGQAFQKLVDKGRAIAQQMT
jgi:hypothetical protein